MKIKKGDTVLIISGKDRGKKGKVLEIILKEGKVSIEGVNLIKKHQKPKKSGEKGQIIQLPKPVDISNVKLICPKCGKATRTGHKFAEDKKKYRICKKCGQEI
ncbi:MAG TPA: 50S ribosomal protein L24 [Candidatus Humimicrobiaceae bacterium]|nr:50S ribosomal protein L24 [Candidatus Humimicrobiaceae bacterium]